MLGLKKKVFDPSQFILFQLVSYHIISKTLFFVNGVSELDYENSNRIIQGSSFSMYIYINLWDYFITVFLFLILSSFLCI